MKRKNVDLNNKQSTNEQQKKQSSKLTTLIAPSLKYILATIAIVVAVIAVFFGESKFTLKDTASANISFNKLYYLNVETGERFFTLKDAVDKSATDNPTGKNTIRVLNGREETAAVTVPAGKEIELDLNGKTVAFNIDEQSVVTPAITNSGTVTITDSTATNDNPVGSGKIESLNNVITNNGNGSIVINSGTLQTSGTGTGHIYSVIDQNSTGTITINNGKIIGNDLGIAVNGEGKVTINNGEVTSNLDDAIHCYDANSSLEINDGKVTGATCGVFSNGNTDIRGGKIESSNIGVNIGGGTTTVGINDDTVTNAQPIIKGDSYGLARNSGIFNFYDGTIIGPSGNSLVAVVTGKPQGYTVVNGTEVIEGTTYETAFLQKTIPDTIINTESMYVPGAQARVDGVHNWIGNDKEGKNYEATTWADISGSGNNGAITLGNGKWGENYLEFDGESTWVDLGEINSDYQTLEVTFSIDSYKSSQTIISNTEAGGGSIYCMSSDLLANYRITKDGSDLGYVGLSISNAIELGKTYHVVSTYDGKTARLYLDGVEVCSVEQDGTIKAPMSSTIMTVGAEPVGTTIYGQYLDGKIYSAAVYNRALTDAEVLQNATAGLALAGGPVSSGNLTYTVRFPDAVTGFTVDDINLVNGTKGTFTEVTAGKVYTLDTQVATNSTTNTPITQKITVPQGAATITLSSTPTSAASRTVAIAPAYQNTTSNKYYFTLKEAMAAANNGDTIKVIRTVSEFETATVNNNVTLDLNGHSIECMVAEYIIDNYANLVIMDSTVINNSFGTGKMESSTRGVIRNYNTGTVTVNSGILKAGPSHAISNSSTAPIAVTINGGRLESTGACALYHATNTQVLIEGGSLTSSESNAVWNGPGTLRITGGTITQTGSNSAVQNMNTGTIQVEGGTISGTVGISNYATGTINITGGTIDGTTGVSALSGGTITIGTNEATPSVNTSVPSITGTTYGVRVGSDVTFNFYDGVIKGSYDTTNGGKAISKYPNATPTGYGVQITNTETQETAILVPTSNYVEYNGNTVIRSYTTLPLALSNVTSGNTIKAEFSETSRSEAASTLASGKTATLDLNGKTITMTGTLTNEGTLTVSGSSGTLTSSTVQTITNTGAGTFTKSGASTISNTGSYAVINNSGTKNVVITEGNITGTGNNAIYSTSTGTITIGTSGNSSVTSPAITGCIGVASASCGLLTVNSGKITATGGEAINSYGSITINGGAISATSSYAVYQNANTANTSAKLTINGGTITSTSSYTVTTRNTYGATVEINGGTITRTATTGAVGAVNNQLGTTIVTGGTIENKSGQGIFAASGTINNQTVYGSVTVGTNEATPSVSTSVPSITGTTYGVQVNSAGTFNFYDGRITGETGKSVSKEPDNTPTGYRRKVTDNGNGTETSTLDNHYNVRYLSGNLLYGLDDCTETAGIANSSAPNTSYMNYSISNGVVTVTAKRDDGYGMTTGRVYLEANKTYRFSCNTNGTWGVNGADTVEACLMKDGLNSKYYRMGSTDGYEFTPDTSGTYWLRLDVNQNGKTYTFSNISIECVETRTQAYGTTLGTLPTLQRTGYTLAGWYTAASGGTQVTSASTTPSTDTTYYAQWTANEYTLTINPNGGTKNGSTAARTLGTKLIYDSTNWHHIGEDSDGGNATRTGYTLTGYYTAATGGTKVYNADGTCVKGTAYWSNTGNGTYIGTSNLTVYAQWTANTYTIKFNANGGSGTMSNLSMTYGTAKNLTANTFTRIGYEFKGWATSASGSVVYTDKQSVNNLTATSGGVVNLHAVWKTAPGYINLTVGEAGTQNILNTDFADLPEYVYINGDIKEIAATKYYFQDANSVVTLYYGSRRMNSLNGMFGDCSSLTSIDLSGLDTSQVVNMAYMFNGCTNLQTIYASNNFSTENVVNSNGMFTSCNKIKGGSGTTYNSSYVDKTRAHIDEGTSNPGYFTAKPAVQSNSAKSFRQVMSKMNNNAIIPNTISPEFNNGDGSESGIPDENNVEESDIMEEKNSQTDLESTAAQIAQIAQIGENTYETLESAIQAAKSR